MKKYLMLSLLLPTLVFAIDDPNYEHLPPNPADPETYIEHKFSPSHPDYKKWAYEGIHTGNDDGHILHEFQGFDMNLLPQPDSGVRVVQHKKMQEANKAILKEMETKGYVEKYTPFPRREYVIIEKNVDVVALMDKYMKISPGTLDTRMKRSYKEIKIAFPYHPAPGIDPKKVKGFAAAGTYHDDGWTGVGETFIDDDLGVCDYDVNNSSLVHGGSTIQKEFARYDINDYPNTLYIEGCQACGFEFNIHWYNKNYVKHLRCSTLTFDKKKAEKLIQMAKSFEEGNEMK